MRFHDNDPLGHKAGRIFIYTSKNPSRTRHEFGRGCLRQKSRLFVYVIGGHFKAATVRVASTVRPTQSIGCSGVFGSALVNHPPKKQRRSASAMRSPSALCGANTPSVSSIRPYALVNPIKRQIRLATVVFTISSIGLAQGASYASLAPVANPRESQTKNLAFTISTLKNSVK